MRLRSLETLFERYRRSGDLAALGEVFDRVAPDLLRLACHLVRGHDAAEDVLQATFVVAIERAQSFDGARELRPWLTGILARQAAGWRRREGRDVDARSVPPRGVTAPPDAAAAQELSCALGAALARLGEPYRTSLEPYLRDGVAPGEIARRLGVAPGTVRMRIHRGLERLRGLLPAGVTAGLAWSWLAPRGLASIRSGLLSRAAAVIPPATGVVPAGTLAAGACSTNVSILIGTAIMSKAMILGGTGVIALLTGLWMARRDDSMKREVISPAVETRAAVPEPSAAPPPIALGSAGLAPEEGVGARPAPGQERSAVVAPARHEGRMLVRGVVEGIPATELAAARVRLTERRIDETDLGRVHRFDGQLILSRRLQAFERSQRARLDFEAEPEGVPVGPSGEFEFEVEPPGKRSAEAAGAWRVNATHPLYFDCHVDLEPSAWQLDAFARGEEVVIETRLELRPAAVVKGQVLVDALGSSAMSVGMHAYLRGFEAELTLPATQRLVLTRDSESVLESTMLRLFVTTQPTAVARVALFSLEDGLPATAPLVEGELAADGRFVLKAEHGGPFALVALRDDLRPHSVRVDLELGRAVELDPIELETGSAVRGIAPALDGGGAKSCKAVAALEAGEQAPRSDWGGGLTWTGAGFEWSEREAPFEADTSFSIEGLAPLVYSVRSSCAGDIDLRRSSEGPCEPPIACTAPVSDLVLGPPVAFLELVFTRHGIPLEELEDLAEEPAESDEDEPPVDETPSLEYAVDGGSVVVHVGGCERLKILCEPERELSFTFHDEGGNPHELPLRAPPVGRLLSVWVETTAH